MNAASSSSVKWSEPASLLCPGNSPGKNTGVGCHALLQGIFPTQGWNPGLLPYRQILYCLSHQGSPHLPKGRDNYMPFHFFIFITWHWTGHIVSVQVVPTASGWWFKSFLSPFSNPGGIFSSLWWDSLRSPLSPPHFTQRCRTALITDRSLLGREREKERNLTISALWTWHLLIKWVAVSLCSNLLSILRRLWAAAKLGV